VLASHIGIKFLFILLDFFLVKWLKSYDRTTHYISLLLIIVDVIANLVEPYSSRSGCSHWRGVSKEKLAVIGSSKSSFSLTISLPCQSIVDLSFNLSL
jgi:hypothetical protein